MKRLQMATVPHAGHEHGAPKHIDPVCGMTVDPGSAAGSYDYKGTTYYFCNPTCLVRFKNDPESYLKPAAQRPAPAMPAGEKVEYTCPMHPEIVRDAPGSCPICGMALEPRVASLDDRPNPELMDMTRRFWIGAALGLPVFVLAMGDMLLGMGLGGRINPQVSNWVGLIFSTPVVLWAGWPFFERGWASIVNRSPNMFTLIAMGIG